MYCGAETPYGADRRREREAAEARREHHERHVDLHLEVGRQRHAVSSLEQTSTYAMWCAAAGLVCCCFPVSILGLVLGVRARWIAREHELIVPFRATIAVAVGTLGLLLSCTLMGKMLLDEARRTERIEALNAELATGRAAVTLDHATACGLGELRILEDGLEGRGGVSFSDFECVGSVTQEGDAATLDELSFHTVSGRERIRVCFHRGAIWDVSGFRHAAACGEPSDLTTDRASAPPAPAVSTSSMDAGPPSPAGE